MANSDLLTIQEAAELSDKSVQTIRRAVKAKKLKHRKQKTPQGFNYLIDQDSLNELYELGLKKAETETEEVTESKAEKAEDSTAVVAQEAKTEEESDTVSISSTDFLDFKSSFEKMVSNHSEERQNFLRLINTLQEKIFVLENQVNLLQAPKKKWYQVWK